MSSSQKKKRARVKNLREIKFSLAIQEALSSMKKKQVAVVATASTGVENVN